MSANPVDIILTSGQRLSYERLSSGIFEATVGRTDVLPHAASPLYNFVSDFRLIEQTRLILRNWMCRATARFDACASRLDGCHVTPNDAVALPIDSKRQCR